MARYLIRASTYVLGEHYFADNLHPRELELPDTVAPSRTWEPLDKAAVDALAKLGVKKTLAKAPEKAAPAGTGTSAHPPRASDRDAI